MSAWTPYFRQRVALDAWRSGLSSRRPSLAECQYITLHPSQLVCVINVGDDVCWLHSLRSGLQVPVLATIVSFKGDRARIQVTTVDGETVDRYVAVSALRGIPR